MNRSERAVLIRGGRIIDPANGTDGIGDLLLRDGLVAWVSASGAPMPVSPEACEVVEARGLVVAPGFVDLHAHLREPGYEGKETIATGTRAAAAGGFTTVCCMPNTRPVMDDKSVVELVLRIAAEQGVVRVLPIGAISKGSEGKALSSMADMAQAGAVAFSDDGNPSWHSGVTRHAMEYSLALGLPIVDHCQDPDLTKGASMHEGDVSARLGLKGWPAAAEDMMVGRDIDLARLTGARVHIAHISTAGAVELVRRAKQEGLPVTAEAAPHHLTLTHERVLGPGYGLVGLELAHGPHPHGPHPHGPHPHGPHPNPLPGGRGNLSGGRGDLSGGGGGIYDTSAKVNPPLRTQRDVEAVIQGVIDGTIDCIATDHAPHAPEDKLCEFDQAANGISGFETAFGAVMSLVHRRALDLPRLLSKMSWEPARLLNGPLVPRGLGTLGAAAQGDVVLLDPNAEWVVDPDSFFSKGRNTPYAGVLMKGRVVATFCQGRLVYGGVA